MNDGINLKHLQFYMCVCLCLLRSYFLCVSGFAPSFHELDILNLTQDGSLPSVTCGSTTWIEL